MELPEAGLQTSDHQVTPFSHNPEVTLKKSYFITSVPFPALGAQVHAIFSHKYKSKD